MVVQNIVFPKKGICNEWKLYFRGMRDQQQKWKIVGEKGALSYEEPLSVLVKDDQTLSLETYFNSFSIGKWKKYTKLQNLRLDIIADGEFEIKGYQSIGQQYIRENKGDNTKVEYRFKHPIRKEIPVEVTRKENNHVIIEFPGDIDEGIVYITLKAKGDVVFYGGAYETDIAEEELNPVHFGVGICTFKREPFVKHNVNGIIHDLAENPESDLYNKVEVYVSDNGQTLPADTFASEKVHLFPNKNLGGAGGFTRTLIEGVLKNDSCPFTHFILMDDDICINTNAIERTYRLLQLLKPEFAGMNVGGELFDLDYRYRQFEAGAAFRGTVIQSYNQGWDMRRKSAVSANEIENPMNFNGWWYTCIPVSFIREDNLPLPVFIHRDDVEYGMRNTAGTILMNGINVWHPQGPNKASTAMNYYDVRNDLICMAAFDTKATAKQLTDMYFRGMIGNLLRYRYQVEDCVFEGVEDFFMGPDFFMNLDPVEKHKSLTKYNYTFAAPDESIDLSKIEKTRVEELPKGIFLKAALCWLIPAKNETRVCHLEDIGVAFNYKRLYLYDRFRQEGFMAEKSYKKAIGVVLHYFKIHRLVRKNYKKTMQEWATRKGEYTSLAFWEKYLEI